MANDQIFLVAKAMWTHIVAKVYVSLTLSQTPAYAGTHCTYPCRDGQAELTLMAGYIPRWFTCFHPTSHPVLTGQQPC